MSRNTWCGALSYGPVSFDVTMASVASDSNPIETHMYSPEGNRLRQQYVDEKTGKVIPYAQRRKCYAAGKTLVEITDEDAEEAFGETLRHASIDMFARPEDIPAEARRRPYRLQAATTGGKNPKVNPAAVRAYAFLAETLRVTGTVGIVVHGVRERKRIAVIEQRDGYLLCTPLEYAEDMPEAEFEAPQAEFSKAEIAIGVAVAGALGGVFNHGEYTDTSRQALKDVIAKRIEAGQARRPGEQPALEAVPEPQAEAEPQDMTTVLGDYLNDLAAKRNERRAA